MKKGVQDKKITKKSYLKRAIIIVIFVALCGILPFLLSGTKIPLEAYIIFIVFLILVIAASLIGYKFKEKISKPRTQRIGGYVLIGLACLQSILYLIGDLLEKGISTSGLIISSITFIAFLLLGIILVKKSKKKD